ncbi:MAG TPA: aminopeptidase [bacterium]|nr:aminopeptidase [bacterium]HQG44574.1 aminopeptidase [bacterium]HQI49764.1 aminopeptidase [bacterium]HQJ63917.1 aminopeptidase [bacterium]
MLDPRLHKLARIIVRHALRLQSGEKVYLEAIDIPAEAITALLREIAQAGALPLVTLRQSTVLRELYRQSSREGMELLGRHEAAQLADVQAYIGLRGTLNSAELADVPEEQMRLYQRHWWQPVHQAIRIPKTRWVVLRWPHPAMAQQAQMSTEAFEDFYFDVCTLDYGRMAAAMTPLVRLMEATDRVHIEGPGTDLTFSIKGMAVIPCAGQYNLPDGEVYTAPLRESVEGQVRFTASSIFRGTVHEGIELEFSQGRILAARSNQSTILNQVLDSDDGARYIGEFALGVNPHITRPLLDTLFDEKIAGSFHLTPGSCLDNTPNGNSSQIHWDMVCIQNPEFGGGAIWFDGQLVRRDGRFVPPELQGLNPENLL